MHPAGAIFEQRHINNKKFFTMSRSFVLATFQFLYCSIRPAQTKSSSFWAPGGCSSLIRCRHLLLTSSSATLSHPLLPPLWSAAVVIASALVCHRLSSAEITSLIGKQLCYWLTLQDYWVTSKLKINHSRFCDVVWCSQWWWGVSVQWWRRVDLRAVMLLVQLPTPL